MGNSIFISYRRDDSSAYVGRLHDNLSARFTQEQVFIDIERIEPGEDFVKVIEGAVGSCSVLLAVIGRDWLKSTDGQTDRLHNPYDFVRLEIRAALDRGIRVIPVLVQGARMPAELDLPADLAALARRQAHTIGEGHYWKADVDRLIGLLERLFSQQEEEHKREQEELERVATVRQQLEAMEVRNAEETQRLAEAGKRAEEETSGAEGNGMAYVRKITAIDARLKTVRQEIKRLEQKLEEEIQRLRQGLVGSWALLIETPFEKSIPGRLILIEDSNILLGKIQSEICCGKLTNVVLTGKGFQAAVLFELEAAAMSATIDGTAEGDKLEGKITLQGLPPLPFAGTREPLAPK